MVSVGVMDCGVKATFQVPATLTSVSRLDDVQMPRPCSTDLVVMAAPG